jgi:hypothetical protein
MHGNEKVIEQLNAALASELTAIVQYMVQSETCQNWGYVRIGDFLKRRAIEEMGLLGVHPYHHLVGGGDGSNGAASMSFCWTPRLLDLLASDGGVVNPQHVFVNLTVW